MATHTRSARPWVFLVVARAARSDLHAPHASIFYRTEPQRTCWNCCGSDGKRSRDVCVLHLAAHTHMHRHAYAHTRANKYTPCVQCIHYVFGSLVEIPCLVCDFAFRPSHTLTGAHIHMYISDCIGLIYYMYSSGPSWVRPTALCSPRSFCRPSWSRQPPSVTHI